MEVSKSQDGRKAVGNTRSRMGRPAGGRLSGTFCSFSWREVDMGRAALEFLITCGCFQPDDQTCSHSALADMQD
jgi:hypothetical protein